MEAAAAAADEEDWCRPFYCVCRWYRQCSVRFHHVSPGYDFVSPKLLNPYGRLPAWSLLVGFNDGAKLRLHRLRVSRCGQILGRSNDAIEIFHDLGKLVVDASASLAPDGVSLCVLHQDYDTPPQALQLQLAVKTDFKPLQPHAEEVYGDGRITTKELPPLPMDPEVPCCPISAAGHIWAPCIKVLFESRKFSFVMLRLLREDAGGGQSRWEHVGKCFIFPDEDEILPLGGRLLQGCTVLPLCGGNRTLILVSLRRYGLFFTFDCSTSAWTQVETTPGSVLSDYIPIMGNGVYIQEDETIYMLRENTIYSYKIHYDGVHHRLKLELPVKIDSVCPFTSSSGYGFLAHLGRRLMCSVWISAGLQCSCKNLHAIVTTFQLLAQGEIEVFHSTCRRIDMLPSMPNLHTHQFCFLQEYKDELSFLPLQFEEGPITGPAPLVLECCRRNLPHHYSPPEPLVALKPAIAHIKPDLFIICQAGAQSIVYRTIVMDDCGKLKRDDGKLLEQFYSIPDYGDDCHDRLKEQTPPMWHFICGSSYLEAVSGIKDGKHMIYFRRERPHFDPDYLGTAAGLFVMAINVRYRTIALTDDLRVFHQTYTGVNRESSWSRYHADRSCIPNRKVKLAGYAVIGRDLLIICDSITNSCLLLDLDAQQWCVVTPCAKLEFSVSYLASTLPRRPLLNGRSTFVDGFIYTCVDGGLNAYELINEDKTLFLSKPIFLPLPLDIVLEDETKCLDYAGRDTSGGIIFFVVQGGYPPTWHKHHVRIITVHVNTEITLDGKMKPVKIGHLDCATRSVEHEKGVRLSAINCFPFPMVHD